MYTSSIVILFLIVAAACGIVEYARHQRRVRSIPIRVHVNGTRGKSSVTRLIGAGLRAGGIPTITKVTGTYPRLVLEDGRDVHIHRRGSANIIEQLSVVRLAAERNARAIVVECMALQQQYQKITEHQMIHANVGVITNVRLDHVDIMGRTLPEIATVLGETIPSGHHLFTSEDTVAGILQSLAETRRAAMHRSVENSVSVDEMRGFGYIEHRENVALALDVCLHLGVGRSVALEGMYSAIPDAGVLRRFTVTDRGKRMTFYNAFAANDPDSTLRIWNRLREEAGFGGTCCVLLNTRQDRMDRAEQLAGLAGKKLRTGMDYLVLIGQCTDVVRRMAMENGVDAAKILTVGWTTPGQVFEALHAVTGESSTIVAIGNMGGMGAPVADYFEQRSIQQNDRVCDHTRIGSEPVVV